MSRVWLLLRLLWLRRRGFRLRRRGLFDLRVERAGHITLRRVGRAQINLPADAAVRRRAEVQPQRVARAEIMRLRLRLMRVVFPAQRDRKSTRLNSSHE